MMRIIKVFLGTSATLMPLRRAVSDKIRGLSMLMEQSGVRVELLCWEDYKTEFVGRSKQQEYDQDLVLKADIIITVFKNKIGEYTLHELQMARDAKIPNIKCYCLQCKERSGIEEKLHREGFATIPLKDTIEVVDNIGDAIMDYAKANNLIGTSQPLASMTKNFYATIPSDMAGYKQSFSSMMRSLDMTTLYELDIHCQLFPYNDISYLKNSHHYVALFKNHASEDEVAEMQQALRLLDDAAMPMEAMSIFQQKPDRQDRANKIRYDIRSNCPAVKEMTDSRTIFTIGMQSLDKVRLQLLLWCLRTKTMSLQNIPNGFSCKDGMLYFNGNLIADMAKVEELSVFAGNQFEQRKANATLMPSVYLALDRLMNGELDKDEQDNTEAPIDCEQLLSALQSEADMLTEMMGRTDKRWENDEKKLRAHRDFLMKQAEGDAMNESTLIELREVQDTLLKVVRQRAVYKQDKQKLMNELCFTIGVYDTYLHHSIYNERDWLYEEVLITADSIGYIDPAVEMIRLNWGNHFSRKLLYDKAIEQYEKAISNLAEFDVHSRFIQRCLCHLYTSVIHSYFELNYQHPRIKELLLLFEEKIRNWSINRNDQLFYYAILNTTHLRVDSEEMTIAFVQQTEKTYQELIACCPLPIDEPYYGEVMCYTPNVIAAYYLDHFPSTPQEAEMYANKIIYYSQIQIDNAKKLEENDLWESLTYIGKAFHHLGFLFSKSTQLSYLKKAVCFYQQALDCRKKLYNYTNDVSDEICIAETLVNYGGALLNIHLIIGDSAKRTEESPIPYAQKALAIYAKYKDNGGISEQLNYYKALQLYASSIYDLNVYSDYGETQESIISKLRECLRWSRNNTGNPYEGVFESVSGEILENWQRKGLIV